MTDPRDRDEQPVSTPYGPHPRGVDEASGGADSSPFEDLPSGEKGPAAEQQKRQGLRPDEPPPGGRPL